MCRLLSPSGSRLGGRLYTPVPDACNESGWGEEEDRLTIARAILSRGGMRWGHSDDDDGKEEEVEEDENGMTVAASGGSSREKGRFKEASRRMVTPTQRQGAG